MNGAIDTRQLDLMWQFLQFGYQKSNIPALKENCELLRKMMMQKTAGQRDNKKDDLSFDDLPTIINCIVIEAVCLYLSGDLDTIEERKKAGDCISRQAAIDALGDEPEVWTGKDEYAMGLNNQWHYDRNAILRCPSAQPETEERTAESAQSVPNDELISKKAAIDELLQLVQDRYAWQKDALEYVRGVMRQYVRLRNCHPHSPLYGARTAYIGTVYRAVHLRQNITNVSSALFT